MKKRGNSPRHKEASETEILIGQAMKEPGVREMMEVYGYFRRIEESIAPHMEAMAIQRVGMASSNTSDN